MKAIVLDAAGPPEALALREAAEPVPGEAQVAVAVRAAGVNYADVLIRGGRYPQPPPLPWVPGSEVCGETPEGRRVIGLLRHGGGYAERVVADEQWLFDLPAEAAFEEGAAFLLAFLTAWIPLTRQAPVGPGRRLLVLAAAGGVGSAAVQVGAALGAEVVAAAGAEWKLEQPRALGAAETVTYDELGEIAPVDVVLDPVGGELLTRSLSLLAPLGAAVAIGFAGGPWPKLDPAQLLGRNIGVHGFYLGRLMQLEPDLVHRAALDLLRLWSGGGVRPLVGAAFPLAHASEAHRLVEERRSTGKVVLLP